MPKDTFLNLPEDKKKWIEAAAIKEFSARGFDNASINRIVGQAQIAKGSFYQYFEDKKDLFKYLVDRIAEKKMTYMSPVMQNPESLDLFTMMRELYRSGLVFAKENPEAGLIGNLVYKNKEHPVYSEVVAEGMESIKAFYVSLLEASIETGDVRAEINTRFIAHVLMSLAISLYEYYFEEVVKDDFNINMLDDDVMDIVEMTLDFIKNGITTPKKEFAI